MADVQLVQKNFNKFAKYGTVLPTIKDRVKSLFRTKSNPFYPASLSYWGFGSSVNSATGIGAITEGWDKNVTLYSIVRKIAKTCSYAPGGIYKVKDEQAFKRYKALSAQYHTAASFKNLNIAKIKALEPVQSHPLNDLYANPNPLQSGPEFEEALETYQLLTGNAYEWGRILSRGVVGELWPQPAQYMQIVPNNMFPIGISKYILMAGTTHEFTTQEILHTKYFNPNYDINGSHLYGFSPLQAAWLTLLEDNEAKSAAIELLQNRGPRKIITNTLVTASNAKEQTSRIKEQWREEILEGRGGIIVAGGEGKVLDVGLGINDLKILEISGFTKDDLCNAYGIPSVLLNSGGSKDFTSPVEQFRKDFIINTILPELRMRANARTRKMKDWGYGGQGLVFDYDTTVYTELQEDKKAMAEWLLITDWFTQNEKRVFMGENESDIDGMNMAYINSNKIPVSEAGMEVQPLPETGLDGE